MSYLPEKEVQHGLCKRLAKLGWDLTIDDEELGRPFQDVIRFDDLQPALIRLNPEIAEQPDRAEEISARLRTALSAIHNDGLVASNEQFAKWLCGRRTHQYIGTDQHTAVRLIDFDNPRSNTLRVTAEATFHAGREHRRYDIVLWVNGLPLVVGETKAPTKTKSWFNAATDIHIAYEKKTPAFFVPNVLSFATDGRDFRFGAIHQPPEMWQNWSKTTDQIEPEGLPSVMRSAELLLTPEMVLDILRHFTFYLSRPTSSGAVRQKIIPRYPQVEAVAAIVDRYLDPIKKQGLVWQHQGSGKTFAMAYAAAKLRHVTAHDAPTIVIVLDRLDLIDQTSEEFKSVDIAGLKVARTKAELQQLLSEGSIGVIVTTIFRFKDAGLLNEGRNIVVMVDEAHRTQEGRLGLDMRTALPNAKFIGLTGTPIASEDQNTWDLFGDPDDPDGVLNHYSVERSIFDGATLPVHVETRLVDFQFDAETVQQEFDALADEENLDEEEREQLGKKASHFSVLVKNDKRVKAVCKDIVDHYRSRIAPLGLKAQIVAYDRGACVAYHEAISELLQPGEEAAVVMTTVKDDPQEWSQWDLDRAREAAVKNRFRDIDDPLKFLIVTAKLLTGFDAPIEGVLYLDKPLRAHTLFQAVCRTNRRWTNPLTGQEKLHGLVVDYVGIGEELVKAVATKPTARAKQSEGNIEILLDELFDSVDAAMERFSQIDLALPLLDQIFAALDIINSDEMRQEFAQEFMYCQGLFEFLYPNLRLKPHEERYRFLARVYVALQKSNFASSVLWHRLGAKTMAIVHENITGITIDSTALDKVPLDAEALRYLQDNKLIPDPVVPKPPPSAVEVLDRLEERIRRRVEGTDPHRVWRSLSERLERLRATKIATAEASAKFLENLMDVARELVRAERADDEGRLDEIKVLNPNQGALTQIFAEYGPAERAVVVEQVVEEVDAIVEPIRGHGWQTSHPGDQLVRRELQKVLHKFQFPPTGELYERAYAYIRENY